MNRKWNLEKEEYKKKILSVSVIPDFFERYWNTERSDILFLAAGPAIEIETIDDAFDGIFHKKNTCITDYSDRFMTEAKVNAKDIRGSFNYVQCDMSKTPFRSDQFDYVICINGMIYDDLIGPTLKEADRLLKEGGELLVNTYPPYEDMSGRNFYELSEFITAFEEENGIKYLPPISKGDNGYFIMEDVRKGADQVLISDFNMMKKIENSGLELKMQERYTLPKSLVSEVRGFPMDKLDGYNYETSVWMMQKVI